MHLAHKFFVSSLIGASLLQAHMAYSEEAQEAAPKPAEAAENRSAFIPHNSSLSLVHYYGFRGDVDPFTVATLAVGWKAAGYSLGVSQTLTKYYFIYGGDAEVQASDTVLKGSRKFKEKFQGFEIGTYVSSTLPVSQFSKDQGVVTKPALGINGTREFLDKKLAYTWGAGFQYFVNRYTTTQTKNGAGGGHPLRQYTYSIDNSLSYQVLDKLSADGSVGYLRVFYQDVGYKNRVSVSGDRSLLNTNYSVDLSLTYSPLEQLAFSAGYSQSDMFEKTGGVREAYLFDQYTTQWYLGLKVSL